MSTIRLSIPEKGRTCVDTLYRLAGIGWVNEDLAYRIKEALVEDKKRIKHEAGMGNYSGAEDIQIEPDLAQYLHLQPDMVREGCPPRIMLNMIETQTPEGYNMLIRGISHDYAPQELKSHKTDIAICGWDEFYAALIHELDEKAQHIGKWPGFNRWVKENSQEMDSVRVKGYKRTNARVAGSAGLGDFVGHFFIFPEDKKQEILDEEGKITLRDVDTVHIDPKFTALYKSILAKHSYFLYHALHVLFPEGKEIELVDVENVEDATMKHGGVGIEIVQSGNTLRSNGLAMVSLPLLQSETIIAHTTPNDDINSALDQLNPLRYIDPERQRAYDEWYNRLEDNLGDSWLNKPSVGEMDIDKKDSVTWLPSYLRACASETRPSA